MIDVQAEDTVLINDETQQCVVTAVVLAANDELIITSDDHRRFIDRFDSDGSNASGTRHIIQIRVRQQN